MNTLRSNARPLLLGAAFLALAASPLLAATDYPTTVVSQDPLGYWRLNETLQPVAASGAANLGSLAGVTGTYSNFPTRGVTGPFAGSTAVSLDGVASSVATPWNAELNQTNFTTELWVRTAEATNFAYVAASAKMSLPRTGWYLAQDDGSVFGAGSAFVVRFFNNNAAVQTVQLAAPTDDTNWHHLVLTFDGTNAALYKDGVLATNANLATLVTNGAFYIPATEGNWSLGARSDNAFFWPGDVAEAAMYGRALTATEVAEHYTAGITTPANYAATVQGDQPLVYYRFKEAIDPPAANLGTAGTTAAGLYIYNSNPGATGPVPPPFNGFEAGNKAVNFTGAGEGVVRIPALKLNTNTVTMTAWVKPNGSQDPGDGIVVSGGSGLAIDRVYGGFGLGYTWGNVQGSYNWSPSSDSGLPPLADNQWSFVALVVQSTQAVLYVADQNASSFSSAANPFYADHPSQAFDGSLIIGSDPNNANRKFNGAIDEVAIWNRSLTAGELFSQYASSLGNVAPRIFTDVSDTTVFAGDPITLTIDAGGTPPLTYTWRQGTTVVGTTTNGVYINPTSAAGDAGAYTVTITNATGEVVSAQVNVTVSPASAPQITEQQGFVNRTLYPKATLRMGVVAGGGGLKYQWYKDDVAILGATNPTYVVASITNSHSGAYRVIVTNLLGSASAGPVTITVPAMGAYETSIVASSPESWWRLDEQAGSLTLMDAMGRHNGYYTNASGAAPVIGFGAPGAIAGNPNTAATFQAINQSVGVVPYAPDLISAQYSIEAWVKPVDASANRVPVSFGQSASGTEGIWWQLNGSSWESAGPSGRAPLIDDNPAAEFTPNQWTHLVITYNATDVRSGTRYPLDYYINGVSDPWVWTGTEPIGKGNFIIGGRVVDEATLADRFFNGQVDEVAIYKKLLPASEITAHYQARFGATTPPYFTGTLASQILLEGGAVTYSLIAQGSTPIALQWSKDGVPILGATNGTLALSALEVADTGTYSLMASNAAGTATQSTTLTVVGKVDYANVTNGLVLHLRFDGNLNDSSGRANNGTAMGSPSFESGIIGTGALNYETVADNGNVVSADYVSLGRPTDLQFGAASSFTISLWIKEPTNAIPGDLPFIGVTVNSANNPGWGLSPSYQDGGWQWFMNDGVAVQTDTNNIAVSGPENSLNDGQWHHFVLSVDRTGNLARSYLDGVITSSQNIAGFGALDTGEPITIGQDPTGAYPESGEATLDDIGVWNRALTPEEVIQIYSAGSNAGRSFDTVGPPRITMSRTGANITINFSSGTLLQADSLAPDAVWTPVAGAAAPSYTAPIGTGAAKFYRVRLE